eukprot:TRINITY_DN6295_c0_g2_i1.p1 TRINITY_DN6295_c0_g2~~TRINITY_DN6295_c0_g2_i1.p1  ORF type:complete len:154 (-),score=29.33 TRINITY_DN6295_c0_g2_i1:65-526(-)
MPSYVILENKLGCIQPTSGKRYVFSFYYSDHIKALVDAIMDTCEEIISALSPSIREKDAEKRKDLRAVLASTTLPTWFTNLDKYLASIGGEFAVGSSLTIADLKLFPIIGWLKSGILDGLPTNLLDPYVHVNRVFEKVQNDDRIKAYHASKSQ